MTILFDLDGTLVDHFTVIYRCYAYVQEKLGLPPASYEKVKATVGGSVPVTMQRLAGDGVDLDKALALFREHFDEIMLEDIIVLPGTEWLLQSLKESGHHLGVLTNKDGPAARKVLQHVGLDHYFIKIFGATDTAWRKPEVQFTQKVLADLNATPQNTLMIGDSPFDIETANNAGLQCAVVATGSHNTEQLTANKPAANWVCKDFYEVGKTVFGLEPELKQV